MTEGFRILTVPGLTRRSIVETKFEVLKHLSAGPLKPSHMMYRARLSWTATQSVITDLLRNQLIEEYVDQEGGKRYRITETGFRILDYLQKADNEMAARASANNRK